MFLTCSETCFMKNSKSAIDLTLTNTPVSFQKPHMTETGLNNSHKSISIFFKARIFKI